MKASAQTEIEFPKYTVGPYPGISQQQVQCTALMQSPRDCIEFTRADLTADPLFFRNFHLEFMQRCLSWTHRKLGKSASATIQKFLDRFPSDGISVPAVPITIDWYLKNT